jgi:hypothetical protein
MPSLMLYNELLLKTPRRRLATHSRCCCNDNCCTHPGGVPTAAFSWRHTDDDCCVAFTDASTAGSCGPIVSRSWNFGDGNTSTDANPTHCYAVPGVYTVFLDVYDASGCTASISAEVKACCDCSIDGPVARFSFVQTSTTPCCFAFFDNSTAGKCGPIVSREWDFGDGNTSTATNPTHCYASAGPWAVRERVTDSAGCVSEYFAVVQCSSGSTYCDCAYTGPAGIITGGHSDAPPGCIGGCSSLNGVALTLKVIPGGPCLWNCAGVLGSTDPCRTGPDYCTSPADTSATRTADWRGSIQVTGAVPSLTVTAAYSFGAQQYVFRKTGITSCPHGALSVPYLSRTIGPEYCARDNSPVTIFLP